MADGGGLQTPEGSNAAFRAEDEEGLKTARANLSRGIRDRQYSRKITQRFSDNRDTRSLWHGIQTITDNKSPPQTCDSTIPLLNELNAFFARFEAQNSTTEQKTHSTSSRRPGDDAVPGQREEIPQQDQCTQSPGSWQHSWACTERQCRGTHRYLHRHFQNLAKSGCCPHMLQGYHHHSSPEEVISILLQWLPAIHTHSYPHEVLWTTSHAPHQVCPPPLPGPLPVCISVQPLIRWHNRHCPPPSPHTSGQKRLVCQNAVHRLQFSILTQSSLNSSLTNWSSWGSTPLCATDCWTSWLGDLRQYGSALTDPAPSHWTQGTLTVWLFSLTHTHTHKHWPPNPTHTVTSSSHFVQHWTDLIQIPRLTVWIKTALWAFYLFK